MNPFSVREAVEIQKLPNQAGKLTRAFETKLSELGKPKHIPTINEKLEGTAYPGTLVVYRKRVFTLKGEKVEGVFPQFPSKFETRLPKGMWKDSDDEQFKHCTAQLAAKIEKNPLLKLKFTPRQLEQIKNGEPRISGLTWHHHELPGKMQLVNGDLHEKCRHTGGRSLWGGGSGKR